MPQKAKSADRVIHPHPRTQTGAETTRQRLEPGDRVIYNGSRSDVGGVKTGTTGVVQRIADSVNMARVHWDTVEVHADTYKEFRSLTLTKPGPTRRDRPKGPSQPKRTPSNPKAVRREPS